MILIVLLEEEFIIDLISRFLDSMVQFIDEFWRQLIAQPDFIDF
jgi:hypothetical protein